MSTQQLTNYTPVIDEVCDDVGFLGAIIYGVVFRYCQMKESKCFATRDAIAKRANCSDRSVKRWLKELCKKGYIKDLTPKAKNRPHEYILTDKAAMITRVTGVTESHGDVPEEVPHHDRESQHHDRESRQGDRESRPTMTESHAGGDRESREETLQETIQETTQETEESASAPAPPPAATPPAKKPRSAKQQARDAMSNALLELCFDRGPDKWGTLPSVDQANLGKATTKWLGENVTPDDIQSFGQWWYAEDWRGRKGEPPSLAEIGRQWGKFSKWRENGSRPNNGGAAINTNLSRTLSNLEAMVNGNPN